MRQLAGTSTTPRILLCEKLEAVRSFLATLFTQRFDDAKKEVVAAQAQAAPQQVVIQQVQPPFNPAAFQRPAPSEAIDANAMPMPNPPPTYT